MRKCALLALLVVIPVLAGAQALPNATSLRVVYNTRKTRVNPQGELKARIDSVDKAINDALGAGQMGELRRQLARGMALLDGQEWTSQLDFQASLVLRSEHTVIDASKPWMARVEQIFRPDIALSPAITARASIRQRIAGRPLDSLPPARMLGTFDGVSRDLRESPFPLELDLSSVADGNWNVDVELLDGEVVLGRARLGVTLFKGLDRRLDALVAAAGSVPQGVRPDVLYPVDYVRNVNRGRVGIGTFVIASELTAAEAVLAQARSGKDPYKSRTGDMERHYVLEGSGEVMPYRVFVPRAYKGQPTPLVLALHGLGVTEDSFFDSYERMPAHLAEQHGFLLAAPLGFRVDGFYGSEILRPTEPADKRKVELSEKDVLEVLRRMRASYNVDTTRVYLMGHSMGAIGAWHLGAKYPELWAGVVAFAGTGNPASVERMKAIPQFVVHGDADATVNVFGSRSMVAAMNRLGMQVTYIEVPGGTHNEIVVPNLAKAFDFLAAQRRQ